MSSDLDKPCHETLLVEYQKAQDSAQHHDSLLWTSASIIFGAMLVLLGFVVDNIGKQDVKQIMYFVSSLGILLTICTTIFAFQFNAIKRFKYKRCKEIEKLLGAQQHQDVPHSKFSQRLALVIIALLFLFVWGGVLWQI